MVIFLNRNQLNNRVLQLQINFRSKIGKYLMAKPAQLERKKLRFLNDSVIVILLSSQNVSQKAMLFINVSKFYLSLVN